MSKPAQSDAAPSPALLLWIIHHGPAKLYDVIKSYIRQLQQTVLPQLLEYLRQLPAVSVAPVWLAATRCVISLVHEWVIEIFHKMCAAWLHHYHWLKHCFDSGRAYGHQAARKAQSCSSTQQQSDNSSHARQATNFCFCMYFGFTLLVMGQSTPSQTVSLVNDPWTPSNGLAFSPCISPVSRTLAKACALALLVTSH